MRWPEFAALTAGLMTREGSALRRIIYPPKSRPAGEQPGEE